MLFKLQKTQVTFSLTLILNKVSILDIPKLSRKVKGYLISQSFRGTQRDYQNENSFHH